MLRELEPRALPELYTAAIDVLGGVRSEQAVTALTAALHRGQWWTPFANRRLRRAAAAALRRIGTPAALETLKKASSRGPAGVRSIARAELARD